jgi:hypothetical protein
MVGTRVSYPATPNEVQLNNVQNPSFYAVENTPRLHYKDEPVGAVKANDHSFI